MHSDMNTTQAAQFYRVVMQQILHPNLWTFIGNQWHTEFIDYVHVYKHREKL